MMRAHPDRCDALSSPWRIRSDIVTEPDRANLIHACRDQLGKATRALLAAMEHGLRQRGYELEGSRPGYPEPGDASGRLVPALTAALHDTAGPDAQAPDISDRVQPALAQWHHVA